MPKILCVICREELRTVLDSNSKGKPGQHEANGHPVSTPCGHLFHSTCLQNWFKQQAKNRMEHIRRFRRVDDLADDGLAEFPRRTTCPTCNNRITEAQCRRVFLNEDSSSETYEEQRTSARIRDIRIRERVMHEQNKKLKEDLIYNNEELAFLRRKTQELGKRNISLMKQLNFEQATNQRLNLELARERMVNSGGLQNGQRTRNEPKAVKSEWTIVQRPRKSKNLWQRFYNIYLSPGGRDY